MLAAGVALIVLTTAAPAAADEPLADGRPARTEKRWYGWQTLTADGVSLTLVYTIANQSKTDNAKLLLLPLGTYLLVPPIIHLGHERVGAAAGSLGLRLGMPLGCGLLGGALASAGNKGQYAAVGGAALGFVIGIGGAMAVDAAVLSREEVAPDASARLATEVRTAQTKREPPPPYRVKVLPVIGPRLEGGVDVGLGAIF